MDLKSDDKGTVVNPFLGDKSSILQETRCFSEAPLNSKKCCTVLTKVLNMINCGERLSDQEWSDLFFGITRLFQSNNQDLRRLVYLAIKSLKVNESEAFVVISSLIKDMNSNNDCYRANSLRVISKMADGTMIGQIERYLKSAIVDKNSFVASSALICGYTLAKRGHGDIPKRWLNEISECIQGRDGMVQYHALILLFELRNSDRLATQKIIEMLYKLPIKSLYSDCLMLRQMKNLFFLLAKQDSSWENISWILDCFQAMLKNRSEIVSLEASRGICEILKYLHEKQDQKTIGFIDVSQVSNTLQMLLNSNTSVAKFAAVRILNELANVNPSIVFKCQHELEPLLNDSNRIMATLVLTILLKIAQESNLDKLVKQIPGFISDISDGGKKDIIRATKNLILKYPTKHKNILAFLATNLREEGSLDFKSFVIDTLFEISREIPEILESVLYHACETIEDCEYPVITIRILGFLGKNIPKTSTPSRFIRFIYNRLILESSAVRAASIDALVQIALVCDNLREDIKTLLQVCSQDNDDEVRDRTNTYSMIIDNYPSHSPEGHDDNTSSICCSEFFAEQLTSTEINKIRNLSYILGKIVSNEPDTLLDLNSISTDLVEPTEKGSRKTSAMSSVSASMENLSISGNIKGESIFEKTSHGVNVSLICEKLSGCISAEELGSYLFTSTSVQLTENESEYLVHSRKHFFNEGRFVVLEFQVANTLNDVLLKDVNVEFEASFNGFLLMASVPISRLDPGQTDSILVLIQNSTPDRFPNVSNVIPCRLDYLYCEDGDESCGYNDVFTIDPLCISHSDCIIPNYLRQGEFRNVWNILETSGIEHIAKFSFSYKNIHSAVNGLLALVNSAACDNTENVNPEASNHTLLFSGTYFAKTPFLCTAIIVNNVELGCLVKITCRSNSESVCLDVIKCFEAA
ncbi:coatomer SEC21 gamma subunit like (beta adaptin) [Cryptosporidium canis]|uniref:Coatomer subunit gamma n=1 Tax=Cryptosporidium canis TaxID=195482 RepID=A0A9D5DJP7_9CRYT|nr:coatomer SEC21 gamma subunit like (beta adaptin) [Cryptosporidium canis]